MLGWLRLSRLLWGCFLAATPLYGQAPLDKLPQPLQPWTDWVLWDDTYRHCPTPYNDSQKPLAIWPSVLQLQADEAGATWEVEVRVFAESWVPLPGNDDAWPIEVTDGDQPIVVVAKDQTPSARLLPGQHRLRGKLPWSEIPQRIAIPPGYGILNVSVAGEALALPNRDDEGFVWLKRTQVVDDTADELSIQVYRLLEDGVPMWLRTQLEVSVSGKSREVELGHILPAGWQLSFVESPIPIAIDEQGRMRSQVRSGSWKIHVDAFRNQDLDELRYTANTQPVAAKELIAIKLDPAYRTAEWQGGVPIDVQLTTYPEVWREYPVYEWPTGSPLRWLEKTRGMGFQQPDQLSIRRQLWLDDDGIGLTFQDRIQGQPKQIARLDVAEAHDLGVVRIDGIRQLITENPISGAHGIELRSRNPSIEAIGRTRRSATLAATGWQTNADQLQLTLTLPPGWRLFALFGADDVQGDWLTAWSLLDLFLLLVFTVAVFRLGGILPGLIAFFAFGLAYHETGAPRLTWLFLLMPLALLQVVRQGRVVAWLQAWRWLAIVLLLLNFVPFLAHQVQQALYPQLEPGGHPYQLRSMLWWLDSPYEVSGRMVEQSLEDYAMLSEAEGIPSLKAKRAGGESSSLPQANLQFEAGTSIQTGIARPQWTGPSITCSWDGPVSSLHTIRPLFISCTGHRCFTALRIVLLGLLAAILLKRQPSFPSWRRPSAIPSAAMLLGCCGMLCPASASAQLPDPATLKLLRERLLKPSDAFPRAAELPQLRLKLDQGTLNVEADVHAASDVAIPIPGRLFDWSPTTVRLDDESAIVYRGDDGYLWVWIPRGIHRLVVAGRMQDVREWVCSFDLLPRRVEVDAPGWTVNGLKPDGRTDDQLFFVRQEQATEGSAAYDQKNFRSIVVVERQLEVGLVWKVHTTVRRLSNPGKAISLQVPLLPKERVLTANLLNQQGTIEVNLGADDAEFHWESEMPVQEQLELVAFSSPQATERWSLVSSPVWNVRFEGLQPVYEANQTEWIPMWRPWPEESVTLAFRRPSAIPGKTLTVQRVDHELVLGNRQRISRLKLEVESSLGGEFPLRLSDTATVSELKSDDRPLPVRREAGRYMIPLQPGQQSIAVEWREEEPLQTKVSFPAVQLPIDAANIYSSLQVPEARWVLWAGGPMRGPAVRFWVVIVLALAAAVALSSSPLSPLRRGEWLLLALGLTQIHVLASLVVVAWLFLLAWRGRTSPMSMGRATFNWLQVALVGLTILALGILMAVVGAGLLGSPEMFILGNGSSRHTLRWLAPLSEADLPRPWILSVSVWYYRLLMLVWALWLANSLIRWLKLGWTAYTHETAWRVKPRPAVAPPSPKP